jgi:uncharacterized repeat protein (TIGR03803 family)
MKHLYGLVSAGVVTVFLAACGAANTLSPTSLPTSHSASSAYRILHRFANSGDGHYPQAALLDVNGTLYGVTTYGPAKYGSTNNEGTFFKIEPSGKRYSVLHRFHWRDGALPTGTLIDVNGTLYGTTLYGGSGSCYAAGPNYGCGTVFSMSTTGAEAIVHSFVEGSYGNSVDGIYPNLAGVIEAHDTLYGVTEKGGPNTCKSAGTPYSCGTVFGIGGYYAQLVAFNGSDGADPNGALTYVSGSLYGTTSCGGAYGAKRCGVGGPPGGTIFRIGFAGKETVLHSFGNGSDGSQPVASLIDVNGTLYGTTAFGGTYGHGTVFSIRASDSSYSTLYSFGAGSNDGQTPMASLRDINGTLYGTTDSGGAYNKGTIFSITTNGTEHVLYSFGASSNDGAYPQAALIDVTGTLYGTTTEGGGSGHEGVVFALKV